MDKLHPEATEASTFLKTLHDFHRGRGTDFKFAPKICGQEIDLHALYKTVTAAGGSGKLNERPERWYEITHALRFPDKCPNGTLVLRQIYQRYLGTYEKVTFLGEDPDLEVEDSGEVTSSSFRGSRTSSRGGGASSNAFVIQVPMSYNRQQHEVTDGQRANYGLSTQLAPPASPFERLCFSLQSGLPNEETFALNVCTLLANGGRHAMQLNKAPPRLVDLLVSQAGLRAEDPTLRETLVESWRTAESRRMTRFWQEHVDPAVGLCLGLPPLSRFAEAAEKLVEERDSVELIAEGGFMATREAVDDENDMFNLDNEISPRDAEAQRVLRIALILHNLSFEEANAQILAQNQSFLRMMMLAAVSRWASLRQVGLDCLSNVAPHLQLNVHDDIVCRSLLRLTIDGVLKSEDRGLVTRCLDILTHLAQCENNQQTLIAELDSPFLERLLELLTVHDVLLITHSLEALYALTELGDGVCERLVGVRHAIAMLVSIMSLDPIAYGLGAQRGMKIVEHFDPLLPPATAPLIPPPMTSQHGHTQLMPAVVQTVHMAPPAAPVQPHITRPTGQPVGGVAVGAQPPVGATPPAHAAGPSASGGSTESGSVGETEALATAWIRANIELAAGASVGRQELYADYVNFCSKAGRRSVLSGHHFSICIRNIFPQSALKVTQVQGPNQQLSQVFQYDNIRRRPVPLTLTIAASNVQAVQSASPVSQLSTNAQSTSPTPTRPKGPGSPQIQAVAADDRTSPPGSSSLTGGNSAACDQVEAVGPSGSNSILKAQLSAPRQCTQAAPVAPEEENVPTPSTAQGNSTLIKSLLASKVSRNLQKQAALGGARVALPEGAQGTPVQAQSTAPAVAAASKPDEAAHQNGVGEKDRLAQVVDPAKVADSAEETTAAVKSNGKVETSPAPQKVYKSSPLLNGLLDRGTPQADSTAQRTTAVNGNADAGSNNGSAGVPSSTDPNSRLANGEVAVTNSLEVRKRRLTFSSEDGGPKTEEDQAKESTDSVTNATPTLTKLLHNGTPAAEETNSGSASTLNSPTTATTVTSGNILNNNNTSDAKRMKLTHDPQEPPIKANGDLKTEASAESTETAANTPASGGVVVVTKNAPSTRVGQGEVIEGAKQPCEAQTASTQAIVEHRKEEQRPTAAATAPVVEKRVLRYHCEWKGCDQSFGSARHVLLHAVYAHVGLRGASQASVQGQNAEATARDSLFCQWGVSGEKESCDGMARRRLSLCTHVQERHCSEAHLHVQAIRRQQISQFGAASIPAPSQPPPHPGYAADAASHAIRRHAASFHAYRDAADEREHPVTRSVRLTAALILRNLVRHVPSCRSRLVQYESLLSQMAMSTLESSRTLAQCLADLHVQQDAASKASLAMEHSQLFQEETRPRYTTD